MDVLSIAQMLEREKAAFAAGIKAGDLMEAAGEAMAARILVIYPAVRDFMVFVGKGNNGGDGLVVARHLTAAGMNVEVVLAAPENELGKLPESQLGHLRQDCPQVKILPWSTSIILPYSNGLMIDALLGVQAKGELRGVLKEIVAAINHDWARCFCGTVALDLPSGLAAYAEGPAPQDKDAAVIADVTLAVGFAKDVLAREALAGWVGRLEIIPWDAEPHTQAPRQVLVAHELAGLLPRRGAKSFKGDFGKLTIVAGSRGFTGAAVLCTQAAQAVGVGLLSVVSHENAAAIIAAHAPPEAMISGWPEGETPKVIQDATAIALGPGLGATDETEKMLREVLAVGCPVLIDADGLNVLAKNLALLRTAKGPIVLTPHIGEMHRLIGRKFTDDEREDVARKFTDEHNVTLVLKGTRTLVTQKGAAFWINTTGNPGLSTGGSGDTLTGIIAGLLAQKLAPLDAARLGVWLHGHAADLSLADRHCTEGLTPTMLSQHLGAALVSLRAQAVFEEGLVETAQEMAGSG